MNGRGPVFTCDPLCGMNGQMRVNPVLNIPHHVLCLCVKEVMNELNLVAVKLESSLSFTHLPLPRLSPFFSSDTLWRLTLALLFKPAPL